MLRKGHGGLYKAPTKEHEVMIGAMYRKYQGEGRGWDQRIEWGVRDWTDPDRSLPKGQD